MHIWRVCFQFTVRFGLCGSLASRMNAGGHFWGFHFMFGASSAAVNCHPGEHWAQSEKLYFAFKPANLIFTQRLISPIHLAMSPWFPSPTPGFAVFNYWKGRSLSDPEPRLECKRQILKKNHAGSNQVNYPPIKGEKPVIAG